ncbi:MAG: hypothetical protein NTW87_37255 [Planctomycetota bacterium]|nr:hypothetical protein [Planctomycetota bacterium]
MTYAVKTVKKGRRDLLQVDVQGAGTPVNRNNRHFPKGSDLV